MSLAWLWGLLPCAPVLFGAVKRAEARLLQSRARSRGWSRAGLAVGLCHSKASSADCQREKSAGTAWLDAGRVKRNVSLLLASWIVLSVLLLPDTPAWWMSWQRSSSASASRGEGERSSRTAESHEEIMWGWDRLPSGSYSCFKSWNTVLELIRERFYLPPAPALPMGQ